MFIETLKSINWVDVLVLAIAIRVIYVSVATGFIPELLKCLGLVVTLFVVFHYFVGLGSMITILPIPERYVPGFSFALLWLLMTLLCAIIRFGIARVLSIETHSVVDKWGAIVIAIGRASLAASMAVFFLVATSSHYLKVSVAESVSHKYVLRIAPGVYKTMCDKAVSRLLPDERYNSAVSQVMKDMP